MGSLSLSKIYHYQTCPFELEDSYSTCHGRLSPIEDTRLKSREVKTTVEEYFIINKWNQPSVRNGTMSLYFMHGRLVQDYLVGKTDHAQG